MPDMTATMATDHSAKSPQRNRRRAAITALGAGALALSLAACSSADREESADDSGGTPEIVEDTTGTADSPLDESEQADDQLDELTFTIEDPDEVLDLDNVPDVEVPELATPDELLADLEPELAEEIAAAAASPDVAILDVAGIVDDGPTREEIEAFGDGNTRNSSGELVILDELASLACANVEIALSNIDAGDIGGAVDHLATASERTAGSELEGIRAWSQALADSVSGEASNGADAALGAASIDATVLIGFLSVCIDGGHVL